MTVNAPCRQAPLTGKGREDPAPGGQPLPVRTSRRPASKAPGQGQGQSPEQLAKTGKAKSGQGPRHADFGDGEESTKRVKLSRRLDARRLDWPPASRRLFALASASAAAASTTIGRRPRYAPRPVAPQVDQLQPTVTSGASYVVPPGGTTITSGHQGAGEPWAAAGDEGLSLGFWADVKVVGHDGPRNLNPGTLKTFPTSVAVQPGDVLGSMRKRRLEFPTLASSP